MQTVVLQNRRGHVAAIAHELCCRYTGYSHATMQPVSVFQTARENNPKQSEKMTQKSMVHAYESTFNQTIWSKLWSKVWTV